MKKKISFISAVLLLFLIMILVCINKIAWLDEGVYHFIVHKENLTTFFKIITNLGSIFCIVGICLLLLLFYKPKKDLIPLYSTIILSTIINNVIKIIIRRPRPEMLHLVEENTYSFPSGHSMASFAFYGYLIYMVRKSNLNNTWKNIFTIILGSIILIVGYSRIYLNVHFFSDVFAGYVCAFIILYLEINRQKKQNF